MTRLWQQRILGGVSAVLLAAIGWWGTEPSAVRAPGVVTPALEYRVEHLGDGRVRWRLLDGAVPGGPATQVEGVFVEVRGEPLTVEVSPAAADGARVEVGTALVDVHAPGATAGAAAAEAERDAAARDLEVLEAGGRPGVVAAAQAAVGVAEAGLAQARANAAVVSRLVEQGAAGAWEREAAVLAVGVAEAQLQAARASVGAAIAAPHATEVQAARDRLAAADARLQLAQARAASTTLTSPIRGRAHRPGGDIIVSVQDDSVSLVQVALPEAARGRVEVGAAADFRPTRGGPPIAATVLAVSDAAVTGAGGPVVWALARLEAPLPPGATGTLRVDGGGSW